MNNEMIYSMFLNSLKSMSDKDLEVTLQKAKELLNENDYQKLLELINKERGN